MILTLQSVELFGYEDLPRHKVQLDASCIEYLAWDDSESMVLIRTKSGDILNTIDKGSINSLKSWALS